MCGIVGLYLPSDRPDFALLRRMNTALAHRGPDGEGCFIDGPIGLAMRRLAVIDLKTGDQPIFNEDRSVAVVYNGEIYNYRELRAELERLSHRFATQSDTEVLVHGYEAWGDDLPLRLNGMFAFALWDLRRKRLLLARDHLGIKPLDYAQLPDGGLAFASELKALLPVDNWSREIDPLALDWFLATRYIPSPRTIYQGVRKLPPAHRLTIGIGEKLRIERYWDIAFTPYEDNGEQEWSDPPREILTAAVARRFGTVHAEVIVEADVAREWPELVRHLDEPFADPATLPTWLMARQTRPHVTVVLTGEGADELFQGYGWPAPLPIPGFLAQPLRRIVQRWWGGRRGRHRLLALLSPDFRTLYAESVLSSVSQAEERLAWYRPDWRGDLTAMAPQADLEELLAESAAPFSSRMQELDLKVWLEGDPLTKADRTTMLASLEARVPFLDREVVEWVARIPAHWHRKGNLSKWLLRKAFVDLLPPEVAYRPKHAFEVPVGAWLRGPLRPYLENALADTSPLWRVLRPEPLKEMAQQHVSGRRDFSRELWAILHLAFWWELYG